MNKAESIARKLHLIEYAQRPVKEIRNKIEEYEKENLELGLESPEIMVRKINENNLRINELKWTLYDDEDEDEDE